MSGAGVFRNVTLEPMADACAHQLTQETQTWLDSLTGMRLFQPLEQIAGSSKSIVWKGRIAGSAQQVVIKRYLEKRLYQAEVEGYLVFRGGPIARILHHDATLHAVVLSHVPGRSAQATRRDLDRIIQAYALMHQAAVSNLTVARASEAFEPDSCCCAKAGSGLERHPVSVGDVKPEHIIISLEGVRIIDLETWSLQRTVWFDVMSAANFILPHMKCAPDLAWIVQRYCHYRGCSIDEYDFRKIHRCYQAVQALSPHRDYVERAIQ
ncbi:MULTISPECIES: hypothetical protein [unclassified Pseudomonas]|jgi:hypothetical protein|uniref:hypothetical protein n=1 Tax=Pseudomonas sp. A-R-26 TaxID=2832404 RepID=UPI001CC1262A|nr:hypothetical protein [Pseudomonas sp. A-R-26]